ncbi:MAG: 3'(2'),5'-bisphosphate nucleotidase CysQ, partial [Candidatus Eremiobacteraeota bacterium]|nr:3'(2'),5'-bisphosphate nucleotidase CysQ [Candidatus Eremiobacteraeota bacterium]
MVELDALLRDPQPLVDLARAAGRAAFEIYQSAHYETSYKPDRSPLTLADLRANEIIVAGLKRLTPQVPVVSEEMQVPPAAERAGWERLWLVDPLDGTKEFLERSGEFTINIALIENAEPILGVVHAPALDLTFCGGTKCGAFRELADGGRETLTVERYRGGTPRVVASRSHSGPRTEAFLARLGEHRRTNIGSSLKICLVATGNADLYARFAGTSEWDVAAAHAVVNAAGGTLTDLCGTPLRYNKASVRNPSFIVSAPGFPWERLVTDDDRARV